MEVQPRDPVEIQKRREEWSKCYPALWTKLISEWQSTAPADGCWLTYSANYLFKTGGIRWGVDPLTLQGRLGQRTMQNIEGDLAGLAFVLLTHQHKDHLDLDLISDLRELPIQWVIPRFMQSRIIHQCGLSKDKIVTPHPGVPIILDGVTITPFGGKHWQTLPGGIRKGLPCMGYQVEQGVKSWLFPGDVRSYQKLPIRPSKRPDAVFAHVWLGGGGAMLEKPPLLEEFCKFHLKFNPGRIILTHLDEIGRSCEDLWDERHVLLIQSRLKELCYTGEVQAARMGESLEL